MEPRREAMVSRSLRIDTHTLSILEEEARNRDIGITVYIRMILQSFATNLVSNTHQEIIEVEDLHG